MTARSLNSRSGSSYGTRREPPEAGIVGWKWWLRAGVGKSYNDDIIGNRVLGYAIALDRTGSARR
jgi:hypothetical protein